ncbi:MAG: preprotein translocase subunit YajC [Hahellaceae bacterium]|nr:preprotein translocase subunit YajC [Hahellaceae bacterium]
MTKMKLLAATALTAMPVVALAEGAPAQPEAPGAIMQMVFFGGFIVLFYFLLWRPQSKRAKEHKELVSGLSKGDEVLTNGGVLGKILRVKDDFVALEIADGVEIKVQKVAISATLPKGTLKEI